MDPALQELLAEGAPEQPLALVLRLAPGEAPPADVQVVARFGDIVTVRLRRDAVPRVYALGSVVSMKAPRVYVPGDGALDTAAAEADQASEADGTEVPLPGPEARRPPALDTLGARGRGVLLAHIDWGLDFAHPDFIDDAGRTRLVALWDQSAPYDPQHPNAYGYGRVYRAAEINAALQAEDPYTALGYDPAHSYPGGASHGTHTLGISGGNGRSGAPCGLAPEARLAFVHLSTQADLSAQGLADSASLLESLDFLARLAGEEGSGPPLPLVVNMSLGRQAGQHDGLTLTERALDAFVLERPGRTIVQSTGNYHGKGIHALGRVRPGGLFELSWEIGEGPASPHEVDLWYAGPDEFSLALQAPDGQRTDWARWDGSAQLQAPDGHVLARLWHRHGDPNNGDNQCSVFLSARADAGQWRLLLRGDTVADGRFHAWIERGQAGARARARFSAGSEAPCCTTGSICNGWRTLAVGAFDPDLPGGPLARFSSGGPLRSGRHKPDLVAPGVRVAAARSRRAGQFWHRPQHGPAVVTMSGTSMAAPHVAGTVALMQSVAPQPLPVDDIRRLLLAAAQPPEAELAAASRHDAWRWGFGRLDAEAAVRAVLDLVPSQRPAGSPWPAPPASSPHARSESMSCLHTPLPSAEADTPEAFDSPERCTQPVEALAEAGAESTSAEAAGCACIHCRGGRWHEADTPEAEALPAWAEAADNRRPAWGGYRPSPFQIEVPLNGGAPALALPLGGPGSPLAFTVPLGGPPATPAPAVAAPAVAAPAPAAAVPAAVAPATVPPTAAMPGDPSLEPPLVLPTSFNFFESTDAAVHPLLERAQQWVHEPRQPSGSGTLLRWLLQRADLPSATAVFKTLAQRRGMWPGLQVLARPGDALAALRPEPGDVLIHVVPGQSFAVVEVALAPGLLLGHQLADRGWVADDPWPDPRAHFLPVLALGAAAARRYRARRLSAAGGRMRPDSLLLRLDSAEAGNDWAEWAQTDDLSDDFFRGLIGVAQAVGTQPQYLLGVMKAESNIRPDAVNPNGHATGLIQFMPATQQRLGWTQGWEAFSRLTAEQQLDFVLRYFIRFARAGLNSTGRLYQATFLPATLSLGSAPDTVIAARGGINARAYEANQGLDADRKGFITVGDLSRRIDSASHGPRWREALERLQAAMGSPVPTPQPLPIPQPQPSSGTPTLPSTAGGRPVLRRGSRGPAVMDLQTRLNAWMAQGTPPRGAPLAVDGVFGPLTDGAVRRFQAEAFPGQPNEVDGIVGPRTWAALDRAASGAPGTTPAPTPAPVPPIPPIPPIPPYPPQTPAPTPAPAGTGLAGRTVVIDQVPLLSSHVGTRPDLILRWNDLTQPPEAVDVAVHLHGHSEARAAMRIDLQKLPYSGLDMRDPDDPSSPVLSVPTLAVLPRGNSNSHNAGRGYSFPALIAPGGLEQLISLALQRMAAEIGVPSLQMRRLVLTAHSGGGAGLMGLLASGRDPDAIQSFDALYNDPTPLITWLQQKLARGGAATASLRVLYRAGEGTAAHSERVAQALAAALPAADPAGPRWRVEATRVAHGQIPRRFGWRLLQDPGADLPGAGRTGQPSATPAPTPAPTPGGGLDLVTVQGIRVARRIAPQVEALLDDARAAGLRLSGGGWRSSEQQIQLRRQHCGPTPYDIYEKPSHLCTPPTARPGHSNHERGLAIDFTSNGQLIRSHADPAFQWLAANASRYGLSNLPSEPWHWSVDGR